MHGCLTDGNQATRELCAAACHVTVHVYACAHSLLVTQPLLTKVLTGVTGKYHVSTHPLRYERTPAQQHAILMCHGCCLM
jgi:hypothetical protein